MAITLFTSLFERWAYYEVGFGWPLRFIAHSEPITKAFVFRLPAQGAGVALDLKLLAVDILFWATVVFGLRFWIVGKIKGQHRAQPATS